MGDQMKSTAENKTVFGIGINDSGYPVTVNSLINGRLKQLWVCPIYSAWKNMLERCFSQKFKTKRHTYAGCAVAPEWLTFSVFRTWALTQPWEGAQLDKDILFKGNKAYGPEMCVFVPGQLNIFINDNSAARGEWPIGVCWNKHHGKFQASCSNPFTRKQQHLGYFYDPNEAHEAWRKRKHEHACTYADMQTDLRISAALRTRYAMVSI